MFTTLIHDGEEHIIKDKSHTSRPDSTVYWEVGCDLEKLKVEEYPVGGLNFYKGAVEDVEPRDEEFCEDCMEEVHTGLLFKTGD